MEKRAFTRQALHHHGHLSSPQQSALPCIIKDFCKTGLFIEFENSHPEQHQPLAANDTLFLDFKSSGAMQLTYRLHVRVARIMNGAIGVEITHNNPEAIYALYKLAREPSVAKTATTPQLDYSEVKTKCRRLIEAFVDSSNKVLFSAIDKTLLSKAEQSADNAHATAFHDTAARFNKYQQRIAQSFQNTLLQEADNWLNDRPVSLPESIPADNAKNLALVDKNEFEDWLLVKVVINRADQHYRGMLYDLQLRMSELTGAEVNYKNNPLNPTYISHAFYRAITPLALSRIMMQAVLHAFEAQVIVKGLKRLYVTMNDLLIKSDVLPVITYQAVIDEQNHDSAKPAHTAKADNEKPNTASQGRGTTSAPITAPDISTAANNPPAEPQISSTQTLSAVQQLISLQNSPTANTPQETARPAIATEQLLSQLTQLQAHSSDPTGALSDSNTKLPLRARLANCLGDENTLTERDNSAVDVTEKFFGSMDSNQHLSDSIKPVFKQLEIPLLKIFIQDTTFFDDANHPARQVLNRLARLGHKGSQLSPQNSQIVEQAIDKINQNFDRDPEVFNVAAAELDELITRQEAVTQRNTERLVKSCDGLETIEKGKYTIRRFIEQQLNGRIVPKVLVDLINHGWRELLVFTLLRDGQSSAIWKSYANVIKSLSQISPDSDLNEVRKQGGGLLKVITIGIKEAPGGQTKMNRLLPLLNDLLNADEHSSAPEFINADEHLATPDDAFCYIDDEAIQSQALSRWVRRARNLRVGSWIEYGEDKQTTQMHLAWIGQDHHKFVFVNHQGMKVVELSLREMAEHLQSGHAKLIDAPDEPFVDRNLDAMVQDIYNQMSYQTSHDELTGLINRSQLERELARTLAEAKRNQSEHALCHINLDQFKVVSNTCGRQAGDQLLTEISKLLTSYIQKPHIVARISGDEFLIILKNLDIQSAKNLAMELKESIQEHRFNWDNKTYTVGASVGIAIIDEASENVSSIISAADSAHLSAKETGRNKIHVYQPNDKDQAIRAEVMDNIARLNKALDDERLKLRCQKILPAPADSSAKPHYEILLSIEDELGIHLAPGEFIHAAERFDRMQAIDRWVIHNVFSWAMEHKDQLSHIDCFTVNLSSHSLNDETMMEFILDELLTSEIPRDKICFEITETTAATNLTDAMEIITELKELGFKFALSDFGTGLSSYTYLKKMPVDYLKIDGAFIKGIAASSNDLAMVQSINEMAHLLGKQTIAEYVENADTQKKLVSIGVDYLQGFHIERPMQLDNLLKTSSLAS